MLTRQQLETVLVSSGLWANGYERTHRFVLSPEVYQLSHSQVEELEKLGQAVQAALFGFSCLASRAAMPLGNDRVWRRLGRIFRTQIPKMYSSSLMWRRDEIPSIVKVDLMIRENGLPSFSIAEIDAHNKHGLGYTTLGAWLRQTVDPQMSAFPGIAVSLQNVLAKQFPGTEELIMVYGHQERFYLPEFLILKQELAQAGVELIVLDELEIGGRLLMQWARDGKSRVFFDLPVMNKNPHVSQVMAKIYHEAKARFLIPPKPFLGSKALLALLRNDENDPELEAILEDNVGKAVMAAIRPYIPATYLASRSRRTSLPPDLLFGGRYVMKPVVSGGMKGTLFPEDDGYWDTVAAAYQQQYHYVLQQEVRNASLRLRFFCEEKVRVDRWFGRLTVYFVDGQVADADLTARKDKRVHGAPDCLQLGVGLRRVNGTE